MVVCVCYFPKEMQKHTYKLCPFMYIHILPHKASGVNREKKP